MVILASSIQFNFSLSTKNNTFYLQLTAVDKDSEFLIKSLSKQYLDTYYQY